ARFLRSSPKISVLPKKRLRGASQSGGTAAAQPSAHLRQTGISSAPHSSPLSRVSSPARTVTAGGSESVARSATWVCPICSFSNPVPSSFDPAVASTSTSIPPCLACGIKPPFTTVLKAAIASASNRPTPVPAPPPASTSTITAEAEPAGSTVGNGDGPARGTCPRCTFANHPSLQECEMCGAALRASGRGRSLSPGRAGSPAPFLAPTSTKLENTEIVDCIKLSFRAGGEKVFQERLKSALIQRKWILQDAPPVPKPLPKDGETGVPSIEGNGVDPTKPRSTGVGIAGLERRGLETRKNNETVIGNAFEDLE
ncbi:hypothetical protein FQN49_009002, partial [Arthroderma sp. PD_2]